ncbi:MAG: DUF3267 domain-containing protein [Candidatus Latescibacteria bacterium]|nr:DUF3267 domain-containing protein [Candidatus Latescibacterota bacterium]
MNRMDPGQKIAEINLGKREFYLFTMLFSLVIIFTVRRLAEYWLGIRDSAWTRLELLGFFGFYLLVIVVHELLHAFALFCWGKIPAKAIKFGCIWKGLMPYCEFSGPIKIQAFRIVLFLPLVCTGLLALVCLWMYPSDWMVICTGVTIAGSCGDILVFIKTRKFKGNLFCNRTVGLSRIFAV